LKKNPESINIIYKLVISNETGNKLKDINRVFF